MARVFGHSVFDDRSDKAFLTMSKRMLAPGAKPLDAVVLLGDQVYGDDLGPVGQDSSFEDYCARYRAAFNEPYFKDLASKVPMYMILDDHEIEDNWPEKNDGNKDIRRATNALMAYQAYQCSHSPLMSVEDGRLSERPNRYWYTFSDGCCDWFMSCWRSSMSASSGALRMDSPPRATIRNTAGSSRSALSFADPHPGWALHVLDDHVRDEDGESWSDFVEAAWKDLW